MKNLFLFLLFFCAANAFAQVAVKNADSVQLGAPAGTGKVTIYGKPIIKNITSGAVADSILVRDALGQVKFIKRSDLLADGAGTYVILSPSSTQTGNISVNGTIKSSKAEIANADLSVYFGQTAGRVGFTSVSGSPYRYTNMIFEDEQIDFNRQFNDSGTRTQTIAMNGGGINLYEGKGSAYGQLNLSNTTAKLTYNGSSGTTALTFDEYSGNTFADAAGKGLVYSGKYRVSTSPQWIPDKEYVDSVAGAGSIPLSRTITTGYGLTGGGNLSADRTLSLDTTLSTGFITKTNADNRYARTNAANSWGYNQNIHANLFANNVSLGVEGFLRIESGGGINFRDITNYGAGDIRMVVTPSNGEIQFYRVGFPGMSDFQLFFNEQSGLATIHDAVGTYFTKDSRNISTGYGLSGGGNLSADRTLSVDTTSSTGLVSKSRADARYAPLAGGTGYIRNVASNATPQEGNIRMAGSIYADGEFSTIGVHAFTGTNYAYVGPGELVAASSPGVYTTYRDKQIMFANHSNGYSQQIFPTDQSMSANQAVYLPNATGTLALDGDVVHKAGNETIAGNKTFSNQVSAANYKLSDLNTAPSSATDTGTKGEIRVTADYIYVCVATNTWVRSPLTTW